MDIAAMSINLNISKVQQAASLAMAKKAMDLQEATSENLIKIMESAQPESNTKFSARA